MMVSFLISHLFAVLVMLRRTSAFGASAKNLQQQVFVSTESEFQAVVRSYTTIVLTADIYLNKTIAIVDIAGLVIQGNGFVVSGLRSVRCFYVSGSTTTLQIFDTEIEDGIGQGSNGGGGILVFGSTIAMARCTIRRCTVTSDTQPVGGGICMYSATLTLIDCTLRGNMAYSTGGGIFMVLGSLHMVRCSLVGNRACFGGAYEGIVQDPMSMVIEGTLIADNEATQVGGGLYLESVADHVEVVLTMKNSTVTNNTGPLFGGGMYFAGVGTVQGCLFDYNKALLSGGGLYFKEGNLSLGHISFRNNSALLDGAALFASGMLYKGSTTEAVTIAGDLDFRGNAAGRNGGGLFSYGVTLTQATGARLVFVGNTAGGELDGSGGYGGGAFIEYSGSLSAENGSLTVLLDLADLYFENNHASSRGGALVIHMASGKPKDGFLDCVECGRDELDDIDCLFMPNNGTWREWDQVAVVSITRAQFISNTALSGGAVTFVNGDNTIRDSVFLENTALTQGGAIFMPRDHYPEATTTLTLNGCHLTGNKVSDGKGRTLFSGGRGDSLYSESSAFLLLVNGTIFNVTQISEASADATLSTGSSDVEIESGGNITFDETSGITCPMGSQLILPTQVQPTSVCPLPSWNSSACLSKKGPCPLYSESCWPPMLVQSIAYNCTPCPLNTYSLQAGLLLGDVLTDIDCFDNCPYGGSCAFGGADVRAQPSFFGSAEVPDSPGDGTRIVFTPCPLGYCCEDADALCSWDNTCAGDRHGQLCGKCKAGYSAALFGSGCISTHQCNPYFSLLVLEYLKAIVYALVFYYKPATGFASPFALVAFYDQFFNIMATQTATDTQTATAFIGFILGASDSPPLYLAGGSSSSSSSGGGGGGFGQDMCAWPGMTPLQKQFAPLFGMFALLTVLVAWWCIRGAVKYLRKYRRKRRETIASSLSQLSEDAHGGESSNNDDNDDDDGKGAEHNYDHVRDDVYTNAGGPRFQSEAGLQHERRLVAAAAQSLNFGVGAVTVCCTSLLTCTDELPSSGQRLVIDAEVECFQPWQLPLMGLVAAIVLLALMPLALAALASSSTALPTWWVGAPHDFAARLARQPVLGSVCRLAMAPFTPAKWYWLSVLVLQRVALALLHALSQVTPTSRALGACATCVAFLLLHTLEQPFALRSHNVAQTLLLTCTVLVSVLNLVPAVLLTNAMATSATINREVDDLYSLQALLLFAPITLILAWRAYANRRDFYALGRAGAGILGSAWELSRRFFGVVRTEQPRREGRLDSMTSLPWDSGGGGDGRSGGGGVTFWQSSGSTSMSSGLSELLLDEDVCLSSMAAPSSGD